MKRCPNPNCRPVFLFGDERVTCPFCHTRLVDSAAEREAPGSTIVPPDRVTIRDTGPEAGAPEAAFIRRSRRGIECHGRVTEIEHHEVFNSRNYKLFNALFLGEPFQFAHQTIEYTIRVENISDAVPAETTDFCLFGSYLGRLQVGDEVVVHARDLRDRRIVRSIYNETTGTVIKPGLQIPAGIVRGMFLAAAIALILMTCSIVRLFRTGMPTADLRGVSGLLAKAIFIIAWYCIMIRVIFTGERRR